MNWSAKEDERLRDLWRAGLSADAIAAVMAPRTAKTIRWRIGKLGLRRRAYASVEAINHALASLRYIEQIDEAAARLGITRKALMQHARRRKIRLATLPPRPAIRAEHEDVDAKSESTPHRIALSPRPVDRVAARVLMHGEHWTPQWKPAQKFMRSETPLPVRRANELSAEQRATIGRRFGGLTVIGMAPPKANPRKPAAYVVRCDCGAYEHRTWAALTRTTPGALAQMRCEVCKYLMQVQRNSSRRENT